MVRSKLRVRDTQFSSKAYGTHDWKEVSIDGRVQLDLLMAIQRDHKLSRYSTLGHSFNFNVIRKPLLSTLIALLVETLCCSQDTAWRTLRYLASTCCW